MKPETKYSLIILALSVIWKTAVLLLGLEASIAGRYPLLPVLGFMLLGFYKGIDERRKLSFSNGIKFLDGFKTGMSIGVLFSLLYTLFLYVYLRFLDVSFTSRFVMNRVEELKKNGSSQADIDAWMEAVRSFPFVTAWIVFTFIGLTLISFFYSATISGMMVRKHRAKAL